jgi:hypothetical protein
MKTLFLLSTLLALTVGCARFSTVQTDVRYEEGKPATTITTKASAYTFFQSKSELANWKAQQSEGEQGAEVGSLTQESDTDVARTLEALTALANAIKP